MARASVRVSAFVVMALAAMLLAGCVDGQGPFGAAPKGGAADGAASDGGAAAAAKPQKSTRLVDRDVEAPEVFQLTDDALWDGRPSLGGVWVASPDTKDPERVIMRNPANGKFVIGALFKRERDNPGPTLQISSDAADALGLLAGQPAKISVTALRREEAPEAAPEAPILDTAETLDAPGAAVADAGAIDAGGVETVSLDAPAPAGAPAEGPASGKKAKKEKKDRKDKKKKGAEETAAIVGAALDGTVAAAGTAAAAPAAAAPAPNAPAPKAPAPKAEAPKAASGGQAIQIGFFSVEANARRAVDTLAKAGIAAEVRSDAAKGKSYWSVIARGDAALLKKIKAAGFADAYVLK